MAKKKSKTASKKGSKAATPSTVTVVLHSTLSESDRAVLKKVAELFKAVNFDVKQINFANSKDLKQDSVRDIEATRLEIAASC